MAQRVATAAVLIVFLIVMMYFGGVVMGIGAMVCLCFAMHEEYHALCRGGTSGPWRGPLGWPRRRGGAAGGGCAGIGTVIVPLLGHDLFDYDHLCGIPGRAEAWKTR